MSNWCRRVVVRTITCALTDAKLMNGLIEWMSRRVDKREKLGKSPNKNKISIVMYPAWRKAEDQRHRRRCVAISPDFLRFVTAHLHNEFKVREGEASESGEVRSAGDACNGGTRASPRRIVTPCTHHHLHILVSVRGPQ